MPSIEASETWDVALGGTDSFNASRVISPTYAGAGAMRINTSASAGYWDWNTSTNSVYIYRFYLRFATFPAGNVRVAHVTGASHTLEVSYQASSGKLGTMVDGSFIGGVGGPVLLVDTWYRIDSKFDATTGTITADAQVDGTPLPQSSWVGTSQTHSQVKLGNNGSSDTMDVYFDEFKLSITSSDYPIGADVTAPELRTVRSPLRW